ncbi:MAG: alpha/beta hydrolase [Microbacterium sp.]
MTSTAVATPALWEPPATVRVRGTLALVAGAGEPARVYERFGRRLAVDGYVVGVFATADAPDAVGWLTDQDHSPRVLVGSDLGGAAVLTLAASGASVDGVVVAGLPVAGSSDDAAALDARTACPVHLGVLAGVVETPDVPEVEIPDAASLASVTVPVLAIHGGSDEIAPFIDAREVLSALPDLELVETVDGLHDALNDITHRSVAARVVLWLERLRGAGVRHPLVRDVDTEATS